MSRVRVAIVIDVPPDRLWAAVEDISTHVQWMGDAESITFTSDRTSGKGTAFDCVTRVGPFRLVDRMVITAWEPRRTMGVRHQGLVTGSGAFRLRRHGLRGRHTRMVWSERLRFPWWMGGPVGAWLAVPVFVLIWRRSLRRLRDLVESGELP
jgi:hypothetical protein